MNNYPGVTVVRDDGTVNTSSPVSELRRVSGLSWEQLSVLLHVSREDLQFWASGKSMNATIKEHFQRVFAVIRKADRGFASENRAMLFEDHDGVVPFDLLVCEKYEAFIELVGIGPGRRKIKLGRLSPEAEAARRPLPPWVWIDALQDSVHVEKDELVSSTQVHRE